MTMRLGILEDTRGTRETSTGSDGVTKQNIANEKKKLIVKYVIVSHTTYVYAFNGAAALEFQSGGISVPEGVP